MNLPICFFIVIFSFISSCPTVNEVSAHEQPQTNALILSDLFSESIENAKPAVVYIQVIKKHDSLTGSDKEFSFDDPVLEDFFRGNVDNPESNSFAPDKTTTAIGSGFIFKPEGYILTNHHVIEDAVEITVTLADKRKYSAKIIGTDKATDIGILKIKQSNLPSLSLGDSDKLRTGSWVLAIGSPYEYIQTVTAGIISATGRNTIGISDYESFIQTDAAINPGNSGGPLINIHGQAIGINTAFLSQTGGYMGIGFAIPINIAKQVSAQLLTKGKITRAWLGVGLKDATAKELSKQRIATDTGAARIVKVKKGSPAETIGLIHGDLITAINGTDITGAADLRNRISLSTPNTIATMEYYRGAVKRVVEITFGTLAQ